jgi:tetratricopeptide (TPR) repeat protein
MDNRDSTIAVHRELTRLASAGIEQYERGDLNAAKKTFAELKASSRAAANRLKLQEALMYEGFIHLKEGDSERALESFKNQERLCRDLGLRPFLAMALGNQAMILARSQDLEKLRAALPLFEEVEAMCREESDNRMLLKTLMSKGEFLYRQGGDHAVERGVFRESAEIARRLGAEEELALALFSQAECLGFDEAREGMALCEEAQSLAVKVGSQDLVQRIEGLLGLFRHLAAQANRA